MPQYTGEILTAKTVISSIEQVNTIKEDISIHTDQLALHHDRIEHLEDNSDRLESYILNLSKYSANLQERISTNEDDIKYLIGKITDLYKEVLTLRIIAILLVLLIIIH